MTLINKTIYPRFNDSISKEELLKFYLPSKEEINLARGKIRGNDNVYLYLVNLKVFQNLHYFVNECEIPSKITKFLRSKLKVDKNIQVTLSQKTIEKYRRDIKNTLNVISDSNYINNLVLDAVEKHEPMMENKADKLNKCI